MQLSELNRDAWIHLPVELFGPDRQSTPDYASCENWLVSRAVPMSHESIGQILSHMELNSYDLKKVIEATGGRKARDFYWIKFVESERSGNDKGI